MKKGATMMLPGEVLKDHELNQLLEIAGKYSEEEAPSSKERVASLICFSDHPVFKPFQLELNDLQIIAIILNGILEGKEGLKSQEILKSFHKTGEGYFEAIQRLIKLEQKGVIEGDHENREESLPLLHYFQRTWRISEKLMNQIFPLHEEKKEEIEPYASNEEYLEAKFKRIRFLKT
ncbi:MAG: hypothetical protein HYR80_05855 [Nitrospirae bacterium]|nr:hypothetical protein [Nitrospirota bacterium]